MASNNFLSVKTHVSEFKNNSDKDTVSEASESGTSTSTSAEDLQKLAVILGLNSAEDVYQERFRVDRRRLEAMLAENLEESQTAQAFFHKVMTDTSTMVNWPARLKIGARSKKDPHVRVAGRPEDVKLAREKIMMLLDTRSNRVTMKIDVSYTDHSHIIGKGGLTIKRVMEETGCHIHFPDSNRTSAIEKSNQVSIAGDMERVERARARVRDLTPLVFSFELPIVAPTQPLPDINSPYVQQIMDQYNVQVMVRNRPKLHANLLVVKGVQWEVENTMQATNLLMTHMCGPLAYQTKVQMTMEISPMHHPVVVGHQSEQLKNIMRGTGAQVMIPDAEDPNIPVIRKSCVTITGQIQEVYNARQQLMGSLPVVIIFDVPDEVSQIDNETAAVLSNKYSVMINLRRKPKQGITSVVIKGVERSAGNIYEARRELLADTEPTITAAIPESYNIPAVPRNLPNFVFNPYSPSQSNPFLEFNNSPYIDFGNSMFNPPTPGGYPALSPVALTPPPYGNPWVLPSPQPNGQFHYPNLAVPSTSMGYGSTSWNPMSNEQAFSTVQQTMMMPPYQQMADGRPVLTVKSHNDSLFCQNPDYVTDVFLETNYTINGTDIHFITTVDLRTLVPFGSADYNPTLNQLLNLSSQASSGYQSNSTGSCVSLDAQNTSGGDASNVVSPSVSPISKTHSPTPSHDAGRSQQELATIISDMALTDRRAPGCEKKTLETLNKMSPLGAEYRQMKADAAKAMHEDIGEGYRVPTPRWSGCYFSNTSPSPLQFDAEPVTPERAWNRSELVRPKIVEVPATPPTSVQSSPSPRKQCRYQQLYELLKDIGLSKYVDLFKRHELDLSTFASLNEGDLAEIGITAFGARKKMMLVIKDLQKQGSAYKGSPAPGAERPLINSPPYNTSALKQDKW